MRGVSHEPRDLDPRGAAEPLAASSDAARDAPDRLDLGDGLVEWCAGAEPASARLLRPRGGDLRRHPHRDAGGPQRRQPSARPVRDPSPRGLAGLTGARRPRTNRWAILSPARYRAGDTAG